MGFFICLVFLKLLFSIFYYNQLIFIHLYIYFYYYYYCILISTHITTWTVKKVYKFTQQQLYWDTHWWRYATTAVTKAHKFTRHSSPGHNGPIEPRSVNHKMESQGHYMETFSFRLVIHLCIDSKGYIYVYRLLMVCTSYINIQSCYIIPLTIV